MSLSLNESYRHLGRIKFGNPVIIYLQLKNDSIHAEPVPKLKQSCGRCTSVRFENVDDMIPPNSQVQIKIVFTPNSIGINKKYVIVGDEKFIFEANVI